MKWGKIIFMGKNNYNSIIICFFCFSLQANMGSYDNKQVNIYFLKQTFRNAFVLVNDFNLKVKCN